ncbi:MAG: phosphonoacetaldehyde dehydrogenase, partial [Gemmatimonadetes bacterium]|nr:phosphonoacetaldehyde dehydrogenase [Gemmatimonadota bacterium]
MSTANVETLQLPSYLGGEAIDSADTLTVHYPYDGSIAGTVSKINGDHLDLVIDRTLSFDGQPSRFDRSQVLTRARELLLERAGEFASLMRLESGLGLRVTKY